MYIVYPQYTILSCYIEVFRRHYTTLGIKSVIVSFNRKITVDKKLFEEAISYINHDTITLHLPC